MLASFKELGRSLGTRLHVGYAITGLGKSDTFIMGVMSQVVSVWTLQSKAFLRLVEMLSMWLRIQS